MDLDLLLGIGRFVLATTLILLLTVPTAFIIIQMEMKIIAQLALRFGPNRIGPRGIFQTTIHGFKVLAKEDTTPDQADRSTFTMAPWMVFMAAAMSMLVIPFAPGLVAMYRELAAAGHEVEVIAPETVQSATGHGITMATPLLTSRVQVEDAFLGVAVDGRPADCVKLAIDQLCRRRPDLVVSGMNSGTNVGINVIYSGTVAAAIEAGFLGVPAIALSLYLRSEIETNYPRAATYAPTSCASTPG